VYKPVRPKVVLACLMLAAMECDGWAVTLPSRMPAFSKNSEAIDPGLDKWIKDNIEVTPIGELTSEQILQRIEGKDPVIRALMLLEYQEAVKSKAKSAKRDKKSLKFDKDFAVAYEKTLKEIPNVINSELDKSDGKSGPALQQLFLAWRALDKSATNPQLEAKIFPIDGAPTCAAKAWFIDGVSKDKLLQLSSDDLLKTVKIASQYQSSLHRRRYLEAFATALPEEKRGEVVGTIRQLSQDLPSMFQRYPWMQDAEAKDLPQNLIFAETMRSVRRKQCQDAEGSFERILASGKSKIEVRTALEVGSDIDRCYRSERRSSLDFWKRMNSKFEERFGKTGPLWVKVRIGYIKWASSDLPESSKIFDELLALSKNSDELRPIAAKAIYYLGKIAEDQNDLNLANKYLAEYVDKYPDLEDFEFSINSLVVNLAAQKKWVDVAPPLERFLAQQALVHIDQRSVSLMAFSLFWLGRAKLEVGDLDLASELWRRLAAEYYSTFYGAMGHYLLEQSSGKSYAIEPARTTGFEFSKLESSLTPENRAASQRASIYLQLGLPERARCEAEEVTAKAVDDYDTLLVRTLLMHASGAWLDAIKIYDNIPRSVRNGLPIGFERVLFPRKYDEIVKVHASKLGVDPDFVFALMRQESVFAKDATSPVGATGLMQLMPATARLELSKLSGDYVNAVQRAEIANILGKESALRDPEINVTLGVHHLWRLMQTYKSPVFALTAYNASPAATEKWQKSIATDDWLTFIERIPYKETRSYVKLILRNYFYYKRWYNSPDGKRQIHIDSVVDGVVELAKNPPIADAK